MHLDHAAVPGHHAVRGEEAIKEQLPTAHHRSRLRTIVLVATFALVSGVIALAARSSEPSIQELYSPDAALQMVSSGAPARDAAARLAAACKSCRREGESVTGSGAAVPANDTRSADAAVLATTSDPLSRARFKRWRDAAAILMARHPRPAMDLPRRPTTGWHGLPAVPDPTFGLGPRPVPARAASPKPAPRFPMPDATVPLALDPEPAAQGPSTCFPRQGQGQGGSPAMGARTSSSAAAGQCPAATEEVGARAMALLTSTSFKRKPALNFAKRLVPCLAMLSKLRAQHRGPHLELDPTLRTPAETAAVPSVGSASNSSGGKETKQTCAVVGSSDLLRLHALANSGQLAREIDAHKVVIRVNHAPTKGYESVAGNRTSFRIVNHVLLENWLRPAASREPEFRTDLCAHDTGDVEGGCLFKDRGLSRLRVLGKYRELHVHTGARVQSIGSSLNSLEDVCTRALSRAPMSGGFLGILLAAQSRCELPIDAYGFYPFCCHAYPFPNLQYKYYHTAATHWVCCAAGREAMDEEYAIAEVLEVLGWLRLHADHPPLFQIGRRCTAVATEPEFDHQFTERRGMASQLADFECGDVSIDRARCVCRVCLAAAARICIDLKSACVGFETSAGAPRVATLKGPGAGLVARPGVTHFSLSARAQGVRGSYRMVRGASVAGAGHDLACAPGVRTMVPSPPGTVACVVCPGMAVLHCARTAGCAGFAVNKEGIYATLKQGDLSQLELGPKGGAVFVRS
ncbi:glycosyltransferase family 29-domain-containing protein [Pavlovales sp. CCMP2436]|nr:glycosyltransferase family 29-domain-containing protein [Pavlovales sp. CCMP2436]